MRLRAIPWNRATINVRRIEHKVGRPQLRGDEAAQRTATVTARVRELLLGRVLTFRMLMESADAYETDIRNALRALAVQGYRMAGVRVPVYTIPAATTAHKPPSMN
jgi:hypothetical protein